MMEGFRNLPGNVEYHKSQHDNTAAIRSIGVTAAEAAYATLFQENQDDPYKDSIAELVDAYWGTLNNAEIVGDAARLLGVSRKLAVPETKNDAQIVLGYYYERADDAANSKAVLGILDEITDIEASHRKQYDTWRRRADAALTADRVVTSESGLNWKIHPLSLIEESEIHAAIEEFKDISVESLFVLATNAIATMEDINATEEDQYYARYLAEVVFAPVFEGLKLKHFVSRLQDASIALELKMTNNQDFVDKSRNMREAMGPEAEVADRVLGLLGQLTDYSVIENSVKNVDNYGSLSLDGTTGFENEDTGQKIVADVEIRPKGVATTGQKLLDLARKNNGILPAEAGLSDLIGIRFTIGEEADYAQNLEDVQEVFRQIIRKLQNTIQKTDGQSIAHRVYDDIWSWASAPSRPGMPIHVKGGKPFVDSMKSLVTTQGLNVDSIYNDGGFQYVKATIMIDYRSDDDQYFRIPIEIQVMDKKTKLNGILGAYAHTLHKLSKYAGALSEPFSDSIVESLNAYNKKREHITKTSPDDEDLLDPTTIERGRQSASRLLGVLATSRAKNAWGRIPQEARHRDNAVDRAVKAATELGSRL